MLTDENGLPRDRRSRFEPETGHLWIASRGEACPECRLLAERAALLAVAEAARGLFTNGGEFRSGSGEPVLPLSKLWDALDAYQAALGGAGE